MDPISLAIVTAIVTGLVTGVATGATTGVSKASEQVIVDGYNALKQLISDKFGIKSRAAQAIGDLEDDPTSEGRKAVLKEELAKVKASEDPELVRVAEALLAHLEAHPSNQTTLKQQAMGNGNVQVAGDRNTVNYNTSKRS